MQRHTGNELLGCPLRFFGPLTYRYRNGYEAQIGTYVDSHSRLIDSPCAIYPQNIFSFEIKYKEEIFFSSPKELNCFHI